MALLPKVKLKALVNLPGTAGAPGPQGVAGPPGESGGTNLPTVRDFGAVGDAVNITTTVTIAAGSTALTTTGTSFTAADIGKTIVIPGAGAAGAALKTSIAGFTDATHIAIGTVAITAISAVPKLVMYGTDDYTAIQAAHIAAVLNKRALIWTAGNYLVGTVLQFGQSNTRHINLGNVTISCASVGVGINFDGGATDEIYDVGFGSRENPFKVVGNPASTNLVRLVSIHHSSINIIARECVDAAFNITFSVCTRFFLKCSVNDGGAMFTNPDVGVIIQGRGVNEQTTDSDFELIVEGTDGTGVSMVNTIGCRFTGTSEGNTGVNGIGVQEGAGCLRNVFTGFHCEANASTFDFILNGSADTLLLECVGALRLNSSVRTLVIGGVINNLTFAGTSGNGHFERTMITSAAVALASAPVNFSWTKVFDETATYVLDRGTRIVPTVPTFENSWVNLGSGARNAGYFKTPSGVVHLCGTITAGTPSTTAFTLPAGFRPGANEYFTAFNPTATTAMQLLIRSSGFVQPQGGATPNTGCSLDGITFLAEA